MDLRAEPSLTAPFWTAAEQHVLMVQVDEATGLPQFYPRPVGLGSGGQSLRWSATTGEGHVVAVTLLPKKDGAPTLLALVQLDAGVRLVATLIAEPEAARIGARVHVTWLARPGAPPGAPPIFAFVPG